MLSIQKTQDQLERERRENPSEQVEVLQEELELEKIKKEIISSLYDDWIYEYNVQENKVTTISGSNSHYSQVNARAGGQKFVLFPEQLPSLHSEQSQTSKSTSIQCPFGLVGVTGGNSSTNSVTVISGA